MLIYADDENDEGVRLIAIFMGMIHDAAKISQSMSPNKEE